MAGSLNGFSGYNSFGLTFTFLSQHFEEAFHLLTEVIRQPSFAREEMEKRRSVGLGLHPATGRRTGSPRIQTISENAL